MPTLSDAPPLRDLDGKNLWYGAYDGQPKLVRILIVGGLGTQIPLPPLAQDADENECAPGLERAPGIA